MACLAPWPAAADSQAGREFWFAWPRTADATADDATYDLDGQLIVMAVDGSVSVAVTAPGLTTTVSASPASPAFVRLPRASVMMDVTDTPVPRGVRLSSTTCAPFVAFFRVPGSRSSVADDMARLMPVDMLGTRYLPTAYRGQANFTVCAVQDGTRVRITDPHCGSPAEVTLNRGQAVMHSCEALAANQDVTGTLVDASAPVAVLSASASSKVIFQTLGGAGQTFWDWSDVLLDTPWPEDLLGRRHAHAPFRQAGPSPPGDLVRIVAACAGARPRMVESDGDTWQATLALEGSYFDAQQAAATPSGYQLVDRAAEITSDRPVQVAAYTVGGSKAGLGDPSMELLDPEERWEPRAVAYLPPDYSGSLAILAPAAATGSVRVDGATPAGTWAEVGTSGRLRWLRVDGLAPGEHRVTCDEPIFAELSGYSTRPSLEAGAFSSPAAALRADGAPTARVAGLSTCDLPCARDCATLSVAGTWASVAWEDGVTGATRSWCPSASGSIEAALTSPSGCASVARAVREVKGRPDPPVISGPAAACAGSCVTLSIDPGWASATWTGSVTGDTLLACPSATTAYSVTATDADGCVASAQREVSVTPRPVAGPASVAPIDDCQRGLVVTWSPATWRPGSPGGRYNIYRCAGSCRPSGDPAWQLVAAGLAGSPYLDAAAPVGVAVSYLVEAEDAPPAGGCAPGPFAGGPTDAACASPPGAIDPGDPDEPLLISFSPHLRAAGYERAGASGPCTAVTFTWALAPSIDPATHAEVWRGDRADQLAPLEPRAPGTSWRDADPTRSWLYFYSVFNATDCGTRRMP